MGIPRFEIGPTTTAHAANVCQRCRRVWAPDDKSCRECHSTSSLYETWVEEDRRAYVVTWLEAVPEQIQHDVRAELEKFVRSVGGNRIVSAMENAVAGRLLCLVEQGRLFKFNGSWRSV